MQRWLEYCVHCKKERSWTLSERNSPNQASTRAKFLKNCWKSNEDFTCKISGQKSFKKAKKMATNSQEVHCLPLRERKPQKKANPNFRLKTVYFLAPKCYANGEKSPLHELGRNDKQQKTGFIYMQVGSKVSGQRLQPIRHLSFMVVFLF